VLNTIKDLPSKMLNVGKDLVRGLWNGISDMTGWVIGKIQSFGSSVLSGIKSFFGIKSPSRVFRDEVGAMLAEGMAVGIEKNADAPLDAMTSLSKDLIGEAEAMNGLTLERRLNHTFTAPAASSVENGMLAKLDSILAAIEKGQVLLLDGDILVGATAGKMDNTLGQHYVLVGRGAL
jgi:phage-related protein